MTEKNTYTKAASVFITLLALLMTSLSSCVRESLLDDVQSEALLIDYVIHAKRELPGSNPESGTKTELQENGAVFWSPLDSVSLFVKPATDGGYCMTTNNDTPSSSVDFKGKVEAEDAETMWAVYPYDKNNSFDGKEVVVDLPFCQTAKEGSFDDGLFIGVAKSQGPDMTFYNVCGGVKFSVAREGVKQVALFIYPGFYLAGKLHIRMDSKGLPYVVSVEDGSNTIYVDAPNNGCFEVGKWYYIVSAPTAKYDVQHKIQLTFQKGDEKATFITEDNHAIKRSVFGRLAGKDQGLDYKPSIAKISMQDLREFRNSSVEKMRFHVNSHERCGDFFPALGGNVYLDVHDNTLDFYTEEARFGFSDSNCNSFFAYFPFITDYDLSMFDFSNIEDASFMFYGCSALKSVIFGKNTGKIKNLSYMFYNCTSLESVDFAKADFSNAEDMSHMFDTCIKLESIDFGKSIINHLKTSSAMFENCESLKSLDLSTFDTSNCAYMNEMFFRCGNLKNIDGCFSLKSAITISSMFLYCTKLEHIQFSQDPSPQLQELGLLAGLCRNLKVLDLGGMNPISEDSWQGAVTRIAGNRRKFAIVAPKSVKDAIIRTNTNDSPLSILYWSNDKVLWLEPGETVPEIDDSLIPDIYYSSDYSVDDKVVQLQHATKGKGIDIYFMGEAYSDRLIQSGKYEQDIKMAIESIFSVEPYRSFRDCFNLYMVYCVSPNEKLKFVFTDEPYYVTKFGCLLHDYSTMVYNEYDPLCYLQRIVCKDELFLDNDVTAVIILNQTNSGHGSAYMDFTYQSDDEEYNNYGKGNARAFIARNNDDEQFRRTVIHEFGHAFAKLEDEYWYDDSTDFNDEYLTGLYSTKQSRGWATNISLTDDPLLVPWSRYLSDARYSKFKLGVYEGGMTYKKGIWRSTENSVMRYSSENDEYNVISRQAIYNRINKLAFGTQWQFDYEEFVKFDLGTASNSGEIPSCTKEPKNLQQARQERLKHARPIINIINE